MSYKCTGCDKTIQPRRAVQHAKAHERMGRLPHNYVPVFEEPYVPAYDPYDTEPFQMSPVYEFCGICGAKPDDSRHNRLCIEYPMQGSTYFHTEYGVYEYGVYGNGSVNQGQERRSLMDRFDSLEEAQAAYPEAIWTPGSNFAEHVVPHTPFQGFDPAYAGERWEDD